MKAHLFSDVLIWRDDFFDEVSRYEVEGFLLNWLQSSSVIVLRGRVTLENGERERERGKERERK